MDETLSRLVHDQIPFAAHLGIGIVSGDRNEVVGRAAWSPEFCTSGGILHGGYLMSAADSIGAVSAFLNLPEGATTSTIESKTNFLRSVAEGSITISARPVHVGRTSIVVQTDITRDDGKLVSRTIQTQAVIRVESAPAP